MRKLQFSIRLKVRIEKAWKTMLEDASYREWTEVFTPGSHYIGEWSPGSKIQFLAPGKDSEMPSGLVSRIKECRPYEYVSIEQLAHSRQFST